MKSILLNAAAAFTLLISSGRAQNYSYAGPYKGPDNQLTAQDLNRDVEAAEKFITEKFPNKFLTVFGSSRIGEAKYEAGLTDPVILENRAIYRDIYNFALEWQKKHGLKLPILTGAGPGVMKAASEGAKDAGTGKSIGYTTYYGSARNGSAGEPGKAFVTGVDGNGQPKQLIDDGLIFSSVALREHFMILHSQAMIFAPGGTGTEWELFQTIEMVKSGQLKPVPILLVGDKEKHWGTFYARIRDMHARGMLRESEVTDYIIHVERTADAIPLLEARLKSLLE